MSTRELVRRDPLRVDFTVDVEPIRTTHQADLRIMRTKDGRQFIGKTSKSKIKIWGEEFATRIRRYKPDKPLEGPLWLRMTFAFPLNKGDKRKSLPHAVKPDWDNLPKTICDVMTKEGFWHDDCQVVFGQVVKCRHHKPFVGIRVCPAPWIDEAFVDALYESHHTD
jgi:Holliday junction resolvase RusA-like endonuclease